MRIKTQVFSILKATSLWSLPLSSLSLLHFLTSFWKKSYIRFSASSPPLCWWGSPSHHLEGNPPCCSEIINTILIALSGEHLSPATHLLGSICHYGPLLSQTLFLSASLVLPTLGYLLTLWQLLLSPSGLCSPLKNRASQLQLLLIHLSAPTKLKAPLGQGPCGIQP